ncbi:MAG: hypothetical protein ACKV0T_21355 [Planctomycetales bacterium]
MPFLARSWCVAEQSQSERQSLRKAKEQNKMCRESPPPLAVTNQVTNQVTDQMTDRMTDQVTDQVTDRGGGPGWRGRSGCL